MASKILVRPIGDCLRIGLGWARSTSFGWSLGEGVIGSALNEFWLAAARRGGFLWLLGMLLWDLTLLGSPPVAACPIELDATRGSEDRRPNILLILADDLGVEGLGCYGGTSYATPNLDQMAREGMRFEQAYAQPLCTNTRIQLMTGKYNHRNWIAFGILDPREKTIGHWLKDAGYQTCMVGKWQLTSYDPPDYPGAEQRRGKGMKVEDAGFDRYSLWHVGHTESKGSRYANPVIFEDGRFRNDTQGQYGPDLWTDYLIRFMREERPQPFFAYYSMALPHWPMVPTPHSPAWDEPQRRLEEDDRYFRDMVEYTDHCVGRLLRAVEQLKLSRRTLVMFYSDNGTHRRITSTRNGKLVKGGKGLTTQAGTHVPLIAKWTGRVSPGQTNADLVDSTDLLPTCLELAGVDNPSKGLDGFSLVPKLLPEVPESPETQRQWIFCHFDPRPGWDKDAFTRLRFARDLRYKLYDDGRFFDLTQDQEERVPLDKDELGDPPLRHYRRLQHVLIQMQGTSRS